MKKLRAMLPFVLIIVCSPGMLSFTANACYDASRVCVEECAEEVANVDMGILPRRPTCPFCSDGEPVSYVDSNTATSTCPLNSKYRHYHYVEAMYWKCTKCKQWSTLDHVIEEFWMCDSSLSGKCDALP